jgi:hypothetical protein
MLARRGVCVHIAEVASCNCKRWFSYQGEGQACCQSTAAVPLHLPILLTCFQGVASIYGELAMTRQGGRTREGSLAPKMTRFWEEEEINDNWGGRLARPHASRLD